MNTYCSFLQGTGAFLQAEKYIQKQLDLTTTEGLKQRYITYLNQLHFAALKQSARTSLGEGKELYLGLTRRLLGQCDITDQSRRYNVISLLIQVHGQSCSRKIEGAHAEFVQFANETLPELLTTQQNNYTQLVTQTADWLSRTVGNLGGARLSA